MANKASGKSNFGQNLRHLRRSKGLTQTELGNIVGLSKRMVAHYENHVKYPPADKIAALAKVLNVTVDDLLADNKLKSYDFDPLFARKLEKAKKLPPEDKQLLSSMIDNLLKKNDLIVKRPRKKVNKQSTGNYSEE
jgi:transcriptional regulator with XRE-family HTH domain